MIHGLIAPHGGELVLNMASEWERAELRECARSLPQVRLGSRQLADLEMLANGAHSPLGGFMTRADYLAVVNEMHLSNGLPWSIPITLAVSTEQAATLREGSRIALTNEQGMLQAGEIPRGNSRARSLPECWLMRCAKRRRHEQREGELAATRMEQCHVSCYDVQSSEYEREFY